MPLMRQLYQDSQACVDGIVGPDCLPPAWSR